MDKADTDTSEVVIDNYDEPDGDATLPRTTESRQVAQPPGKNGRVYPCSFNQFDNLQDEVMEATDDTAVSGRRQDRASLTGYESKSRFSFTRYANPNASDAPPESTNDAMTKLEVVETGSGITYLVFTLVLSLYYLHLLAPVMSNDLWWAGFNSSGAQSYLIDVFNSQLVFANDNISTSLDLTMHGMVKDYSTYVTPIYVPPVYTRSMYYFSQSNDLASIIHTLKTLSDPDMIATHYCWVDFNRTFEVAHTNRRQQRCALRYADNAAMYWETQCRLTQWGSWMWAFGERFDALMGHALRDTGEGRLWLNRTANAFTTVDAEVALWEHHGLTRYLLQYSNQKDIGIDETIQVVNAFGAVETITIKRAAQESRGAWTTYIMTWGPWNEYMLQSSVVRSDPFHPRFNPPCSYDDYVAAPEMYTCYPCDDQHPLTEDDCSMTSESRLLLPQTPSYHLTRTHIGQFGSIDLFLVPVPPSLTKLAGSFTAAVTALLQSNDAFRQAMAAIPNVKVDPVPVTWHSDELLYMGGDPTCSNREPKPFVQSSIAFDQTCSVQDRHTLQLHSLNVLFGLFASSPSPVVDICALCPTLWRPCQGVLAAGVHALTLFQSSLHYSILRDATPTTRDDVVALDPTMIQYAVSEDNWYLLDQSLLSGSNSDLVGSTWDVFGWIYLFEWAEMTREVVSVEGDFHTLKLISDKYKSNIHEAQVLEVPHSSSQYLSVISIAVSVISVVVGILVAIYTVILRGRIVGRNLFQFNRIVGAVWLGRPFLLLRGMTAIIVLSTAPLTFVTRHNMASFEFQPRSLVESVLVAGEATWITYVLNDILLMMSRNAQPHFAPLSAGLSWLIMVSFDVWQPPQAITTLRRSCHIDRIREKLLCQSGSVQLGEVNRALTCLLVQALCSVMSFALVAAWHCVRKLKADGGTFNSHLLLSGTASAFLHKDIADTGTWQIDRASCAICGLLAVRDSIFDLKLWLLVHQPDVSQVKWGMKVFDAAELNPVAQTTSSKSQRRLTSHVPMNRRSAVLGLLYMGSTIVGSVTYLTLTKTNLANDFFWANYNSSREHVYLARLFNRELVLRPSEGPIDLTDNRFLDDSNFNITSLTPPTVDMPRSYVSQVQIDQTTKLLTVVRGLRTMDACLAPWISTQYCYLDFQRRWEMANSAARQARCERKYTGNAAVFLESVLRNVQWLQLQTCWGSSVDTAFGSTIQSTNVGRQWWASLPSVAATTLEDEEVIMWQSHGISSFSTDWQNYKTIGLIEMFDVQNAFGVAYPMTLKHTNGTFRWATQTSMKMYWGFASDLWAISEPSNIIYHKSLIRQNADFAFTNVSLEEVLVQNGTIPVSVISGTGGAFSVFRSVIGPFGSVDLKHVPVPPSLVLYVSTVKDTLARQLATSSLFLQAYSRLEYPSQVGYVPVHWLEEGWLYSVGGNLLCHDLSSGYMGGGMRITTGAFTPCGDPLGEFVVASPMALVLATLGTNLTRDNVLWADVEPICAHFVGMDFNDCISSYLDFPRKFLRNATYFPPERAMLSQFQALAKHAKADVQAATVEVAQYATSDPASPDIHLLRQLLFDESLASFDYVSWLLVFDWVMAIRDVIAFEGDVGNVHAITSRTNAIGSLVNPLEIPVNVAAYIRYACIYVTTVIISVAALATIYLVLAKGYVEGLNLLEINRVAGIVWIGRTILLVRSLSAIGLLSTEVLTLDVVNTFLWGFQSQIIMSSSESNTDKAMRFVKTFLAAGEVSWLGFVLNDIFVVVTQQYTTAYVIKCNFMIWGVSAVLSWVVPATHSATISRECDMPQVDFQLVCRSGTIAIGSFSRFSTLVGLCVGSTVVCYAYERLRRPGLKPPTYDSLLLAASAKYVYFLDPSSAAINGILSVRLTHTFYIFDLKSWRLFVIDETPEMRRQKEAQGAFHLLTAIPLIQ
ncbi:hypothetical protein DYB30_007295 [Aphanomyces astaci]|uniref:Uncharacterized protein n=1 Tax=Aphanomyces astaci TaxID=112090 RepID=A0A397D9W9_APHAT|nr:hypothetical protein DYB30_007295 [Aphanomyces astaci]